MSRQSAAARPDASGYIWRNGMRVKVGPKPAALAPVPSVQAPPTHKALPQPPAAAEHQAPKRKGPVPHLRPVSMLAFWFIWNADRGPPKQRHETKEGAIGEARRLAAAHPGQTFMVYAATLVDEVKVDAPPLEMASDAHELAQVIAPEVAS